MQHNAGVVHWRPHQAPCTSTTTTTNNVHTNTHSKRQSIYLNDPSKQYAPVNDSCPYDLHNTDLTVKVCMQEGDHLCAYVHVSNHTHLNTDLHPATPTYTHPHPATPMYTHPYPATPTHSFATLPWVCLMQTPIQANSPPLWGTATRVWRQC